MDYYFLTVTIIRYSIHFTYLFVLYIMYEKKKRIFSVDKISLRYVLRSSNFPITFT